MKFPACNWRSRFTLLSGLGLLLWLSVSPAQGAPSAVRSLPAACVSSNQSYTTTLTINPGTTPPASMIVREELPAGWTVTSATWNGNPITTVLEGDQIKKWLFGLPGSPAVGAGTLVYVTRPGPAVEPSYAIFGSIAYGGSPPLVATTTGDNQLTSCDQDTDGLPDDWERAYFEGSPVIAGAQVDDDGDGAVNMQEYRARTHPRDAASFFGFTTITAAGGEVWLRWKAAAASDVQVLYQDSLAAGGTPATVTYVYHAAEGEKEIGPLSMTTYPSGFFFLRMQTTR